MALQLKQLEQSDFVVNVQYGVVQSGGFLIENVFPTNSNISGSVSE